MSERCRPQFISEPITPVPGTSAPTTMARGEPGLPARFTWRGVGYAVSQVLERWKSSTPEGGRAGAERYVRRHWYAIETSSGQRMTLYCDRQVRNRKKPKARWWLYTVD